MMNMLRQEDATMKRIGNQIRSMRLTMQGQAFGSDRIAEISGFDHGQRLCYIMVSVGLLNGLDAAGCGHVNWTEGMCDG